MQQTPSTWEQALVTNGIEIGLIVSGFFGTLLMVGKKSAQKLSTTIISIAGGTACANYLTPVVLHFAPATIQDSRAKFAAAFVMGFLGLKGLEWIVEKWFGEKFGYGKKKDDTAKKAKKAKKTSNTKRVKKAKP